MKEYSRIVRLSPFAEAVCDDEGREYTIVKDIYTYNTRGRYHHIRYEIPTNEELVEFSKKLSKEIITDFILGLSFIGIFVIIGLLLTV